MKCAVGHPINAAFAFHGDHFLFGHACSVDGRYWAADPCTLRVVDAADIREAMTALGGTLGTPEEWRKRFAVAK
jgi:hypothetical protein